jgi:hypothetical protein
VKSSNSTTTRTLSATVIKTSTTRVTQYALERKLPRDATAISLGYLDIKTIDTESKDNELLVVGGCEPAEQLKRILGI